MALALSTIDTQHDDMIHDAQLDYYGKRMATCSSDRTIKIWELQEDSTVAGQTPLCVITGHEGPVWQVVWAHPAFGSVLASCSYDRRVCVWKEVATNEWKPVYEYAGHDLSVNSIAWAPHELGLCLACASSDSQISILSLKDDTWDTQKIQAHQIGVNCVTWAPAASGHLLADLAGGAAADQQAQQQQPALVKRFASGGCDNLIKTWRYIEEGNIWKNEDTLEYHGDWVRDVAWAPNIGLATQTLASCSQDGAVVVWTLEGQKWRPTLVHKFSDVVWRVSWSLTGNMLAVSGGDNKVTLWKEALDGKWECVSTIDDVTASS